MTVSIARNPCGDNSDEGRLLKIFPGSEKLRYTIPFADPQETINYLRQMLGIGLDVALSAARERRHHLVGQRLAALAALRFAHRGSQANAGLTAGSLLHWITLNNSKLQLARQ
jgi:hypothetical protein